MTYKEHINKLCKKYKIKKYIRKRIAEQAFYDKRLIYIRPVNNIRNYVIALHEIGHIVTRPNIGNFNIIKEEKNAWKWAKKNTVTWNSNAEKCKCESLESYYSWLQEIELIKKTINDLNKSLKDIYRKVKVKKK